MRPNVIGVWSEMQYLFCRPGDETPNDSEADLASDQQMDDWDVSKVRQAIEEFMEKRGLNPSAWCDAAGLDNSTLRKFLDGVHDNIRLEALWRLAHAEKVTVSEMIGDAAPTLASPEIAIDFQRLVEALERVGLEAERHHIWFHPDDFADLIITYYREPAALTDNVVRLAVRASKGRPHPHP